MSLADRAGDAGLLRAFRLAVALILLVVAVGRWGVLLVWWLGGRVARMEGLVYFSGLTDALASLWGLLSVLVPEPAGWGVECKSAMCLYIVVDFGVFVGPAECWPWCLSLQGVECVGGIRIHSAVSINLIKPSSVQWCCVGQPWGEYDREGGEEEE